VTRLVARFGERGIEGDQGYRRSRNHQPVHLHRLLLNSALLLNGKSPAAQLFPAIAAISS